MLRPTTKRERDIKCVRVEPRKRVKSASPEDRTGTGTDPDDTSKRSELLACPFYKHDPTKHMDCLLRNRLKSTSFVRQHLQRAHRQPIHCSLCGQIFRKEVERDDHNRQVQCELRPVSYKGLNQDQLMQIRKPPRESLDEQGRWNSMWKILFPGEPCPEDPYVGSAQEEILGIARRAVEAASPGISPKVLQILNWDAVSTIYTRRSTDKTSPPSSQDNWPPTPEVIDDHTSRTITKPPVRRSRAPRAKFTAAPTIPSLEKTLQNANAMYPGHVYDQLWNNPFFFQSENVNGTAGEAQRSALLSEEPLLLFDDHSTPSSSPLAMDDLCPQFDPDQQIWLPCQPWLSPTNMPQHSSLPICGYGFSPLAGTEVIDLTQ